MWANFETMTLAQKSRASFRVQVMGLQDNRSASSVHIVYHLLVYTLNE